MIKKICLTFTLSALSSIALADQLPHIQTEIKAIVAAYQKAVVTIKVLTKKMPSDLATTTTSAIDKLVTSKKFQENLNKTTDSQCESIINGAFFKDMNYKPTITDYSSEKYTPIFMSLFNATAQKAQRQLLWNKLRKKEKELMAELNPKETSKKTASTN